MLELEWCEYRMADRLCRRQRRLGPARGRTDYYQEAGEAPDHTRNQPGFYK